VSEFILNLARRSAGLSLEPQPLPPAPALLAGPARPATGLERDTGLGEELLPPAVEPGSSVPAAGLCAVPAPAAQTAVPGRPDGVEHAVMPSTAAAPASPMAASAWRSTATDEAGVPERSLGLMNAPGTPVSGPVTARTGAPAMDPLAGSEQPPAAGPPRAPLPVAAPGPQRGPEAPAVRSRGSSTAPPSPGPEAGRDPGPGTVSPPLIEARIEPAVLPPHSKRLARRGGHPETVVIEPRISGPDRGRRAGREPVSTGPPVDTESREVHVRIGTVELRAAPPPPAPPRPAEGSQGFDRYTLLRSYVFAER
jgi:hypothetical protein